MGGSNIHDASPGAETQAELAPADFKTQENDKLIKEEEEFKEPLNDDSSDDDEMFHDAIG